MLVSVLLRYDARARIVVIFTNSEGCPPTPPNPNQLSEPYALWPTARTAASAKSETTKMAIDER